MRRLILTLILLASVSLNLNAQFHSARNDVSGNAGNMGTITGPPGSESNRNAGQDSSAVATDSIQGFSLRKLVRGYAGKDTLTPGYMMLGSAIIPGASQIHNKDYWKVPLIYAGIGAGVYEGIHFNHMWHETGDAKYKTYRTASYIAAGAVYWAHLLDGAACFKTDIKAPAPAKSTIYSILLPGLGQANNGDYWKIPIWTGGFVACGYFYHFNDIQYKRFRYICNVDKTKETSGYIGSITSSQAEWYRDSYRRYRDYSILAIILVYALNVIDANVFAYMADFDVSDNIASIEVQPTIIEPLLPQYTYFNSSTPTIAQSAVGLKFQFKF